MCDTGLSGDDYDLTCPDCAWFPCKCDYTRDHARDDYFINLAEIRNDLETP